MKSFKPLRNLFDWRSPALFGRTRKSPDPKIPENQVPEELLLETYSLCHDKEVLDREFEALRRFIFKQLEGRRHMNLSPHMFWEYGKLPGKRMYFYIQPAGESGFLVERSGAGWLVSLSHKVVAEDLFIRSETPLDVVSVWGRGEGFIRLKSQLFGFNGDLDFLSVYVYRDRFWRWICDGSENVT